MNKRLLLSLTVCTLVTAKSLAATSGLIPAGVTVADCTSNVLTALGNYTTGTVILQADWLPIDYTITYMDDDTVISGLTPTSYNIESDDITLPRNATKTGYRFVAWCGDADLTDCGDEFQTIPSGSTGDKVFYAQWALNVHNIVYQHGEHGSGDGLTVVDVENGASHTVLSIDDANVTADNGYQFAGWDCGDNENYMPRDTFTMPDENVICVAQWNQISYTITYKDGNTNISGLTPNTYTVADTPVTLPDDTQTHKDHFVFQGWHQNSDLTDNIVTKIPSGAIGDKVFFAEWEFVCESGKWMHIGDEKMCLYSEQWKTHPAGAINIKGTKYYMLLTDDENVPIHKGSAKKFHIKIGNKIYNAHDASTDE